MAAAELEQLLTALLEPDSAALRRATARLREAFADPQTPARLGLLLSAAPRPQVRQLAAVLLRRRLLGKWRRLDPALRQSLPALLADALEKETERPVTLALAQLAAILLRWAGLGAWGPLGAWVQGAARDPRPPRQEAALLVLSAALEAAPEALAPHGPALAALCRGALAPEAPPGPTALALRALGGLAATVGDTQTELLRSLLPDVLAALRKLIDLDEERATEALEVLDEFLEADPASVTSDLRPLLDLCLQVGGDEGRGDALRARALAVVAFLGQKRPKALLRGGLLPLALGGLLAPLCAPPRPGRPDPEEEEEEGGEGLPPRAAPCPRHAAAQALEALAEALPPDRILQPLVPQLAQALGSPQAGARKGALLALAALGGPCGETLRRRYRAAALGALRGGLGDPDSAVRGAAAFALRSLADCLQPEAAALAGEAMPAALGALGGAPPPSQSKAWFVLESLVETLGEAVGPWVPPVLEAALGALGPGAPLPRTELGLSALHALAEAAGEGLRPHAGRILGALTPLLRPGPPERRPLRLQALGALGALGPAVAGEGLGAALELGLALAGEGDEPEGRRVLFALAGAGSRALGEGLAPLLPSLLPVLQGALLRPPPAAPPEGADSFLLFDDVSDDDDEGAEPMEDDVSEGEELVEVEVGGAWAQEAEEACEALGELAEHTGAAFQPFAEAALEAVTSLLQLPHPALRRAAYGTLGSLCRPLGGAPAPPPAQGPAPPLCRALQALAGGVRGEGRAGEAGAALGALGRLLEGPSPPLPLPPALLPPIGRLLCDVIKGEIASLKGDADGDADEEEAEAAAELREAAGEGLAALGGALGGAAAPFFLEALEPLLGALAARGDAGRRSWAAAILGLAGGALGEAVGPALPRVGPALGEAASRDPEAEVRSNAFYALGRLAQAAGHALRHVGAWPGEAVLTRALRGGEGPGRGRDNACAALVRHQGALPPETWEGACRAPLTGPYWFVLVVPLVLGALPLRHDLEEEEPVLRYLQGALRRCPALLQQHAAELPPALAFAVGSGRLPHELEAALVQLLREVWGSCPTAFEEGLARLPHGEATALRRALGVAEAP